MFSKVIIHSQLYSLFFGVGTRLVRNGPSWKLIEATRY